MDDKSSDILGGRTLPIVRRTESGHWSNLSSLVKIASILGLLLLALVAFKNFWDRFLKWQEDSYRLATRRRHGIPDNDHRPFNVAYAAVLRSREAKERAMEKLPKPDQQASALADAQGPRQRFSDAAPRRHMAGAWPSMSFTDYADVSGAARNYPTPSPTDALHFADRPKMNLPSIHITDPEPHSKLTDITHSSSRASKLTAHDDSRKRVLDDEDDLEPAKKTRVEGEELTDGEEDAEWQQPSDREGDRRPERGSKRVYGERDHETHASRATRDKRARKVTPEDQIMGEEGIDGDELTDLKTISRGRKRDRAEAGSTFGGDDAELPMADDGEDDGKNSRRRKRRTMKQRKSDVHSRGQKRDRDAKSHSDSEEDENRVKKRTSRKQKGRNDGKEDTASDVSMGDSQISQDLLCKGRRIGDEWEANGVLWKVGPNGDRLRQALVKQARSKFVMPKDSQHPDREANLEVFVESWLTDEQYKEAQVGHQLAWQDSPPRRTSIEPETPGNVPDSPKPGKNLLWASTAQKDSPTPRRGPFRQSIVTNVGIHIDPFRQSQYGPGRRVVSSYSPVTAGPINGIGSPKQKAFSKWEKQDLEAQAMAKIRFKSQEIKAKQAAAAPEVKEVKKLDEAGGTGIPAPSLNVINPAPTPSVSFPTLGEKPPMFGVSPPMPNTNKEAEPAKPSTIQFGPPPTAPGSVKSPFFAAPAAPDAQSKPPTSTGASTPFSFGSQFAKPQQPAPGISNPSSSSLNVPAFGGGMTRQFGPGVTLSPSMLGNSGATTGPSTPAATSSQPMSNNGGPVTSPAAAPSQPIPAPVQKDAAPKAPVFSFAPSSGSSPQFSFGTQANTSNPIFGAQLPKKPEQKGDGGSSMSRFGGFGGQSSQTASTSFSGGDFPKPAALPIGGDLTKPTPVFGNNTAQSKPLTVATPAASGTSTLKFDFGMKSTTPSLNPNTKASFTPPPSGVPKSAPTTFSFAATPPPKPKPTESANTSAPKFNMAAPSNSVFGSTSSTESPATVPSAQSQDLPAKPAFGGFGGDGGPSAIPASVGGSVFGGSIAQPKPGSAFPAPGTDPTSPNPFAPSGSTAGNAFSNLTTTSQSTPFLFGSTSTFGNTSASSSNTKEGSAPSTLGGPAQPKQGSVFAFPSTSSTSSDPFASAGSNKGGSVFGGLTSQTSQSTPFSFSNTGSANIFGKSSTSASNTDGIEAAKPATMFGQSSGTQSVDAQSSANNSSAPVPTPSTFGFTGTSSLFGQQQ